MRIGPVALAELPDINDISIQHENFRSNTPEIIQKLTGMTAIGSQMHIRYNNYVNVAFSHLPDKDRLDLLTKFLEIFTLLLSSRRPAGGADCGSTCSKRKKNQKNPASPPNVNFKHLYERLLLLSVGGARH